MAHTATYQAILNDLNRDVARAQPADVWQFCANWFNQKLADQRNTNRSSSPYNGPASASQQHQGMTTSPTRADAPPSASAFAGPGSLRKKHSHPSLVGQNYTFGGSSQNAPNAIPSHLFQPPSSDLLSPFSENGPTPTNAEAPASPFGLAQAHGSRGATASRPSGPPSPARKSGSQSSQSTPTSSSAWSKSYSGSSAKQQDDEDDDVYDPRDQSSSTGNMNTAGGQAASPMGIPVGYNLGRRTSVSAESLDPSASANIPKTVIPKSASQRARIETSIKGNLLFRNLDEEQHNDVLNAMKEVRVPQGTEVIVQGAVGDFFYVVESGTFEVWVKPPATHTYDANTRTTTSDGAPAKRVAVIEAGGSFGELALMYNAPRAATVVAVSPSSTLWALDRVTFRSILMEHTSRKRKMYEVFLAEVNILVSLEDHERAKIADALEEKIYEEGEAVVVEGEVGKNFYIIESGMAEVVKRRPGRVDDERVSTLGKGDYFGELALLNSAPRAATVRAMPGHGRLRVATLGEKAFTRLLGPVVDILQRRAERQYGQQQNNGGGSAPVNGQNQPQYNSRSGSVSFNNAHDMDSQNYSPHGTLRTSRSTGYGSTAVGA